MFNNLLTRFLELTHFNIHGVNSHQSHGLFQAIKCSKAGSQNFWKCNSGVSQSCRVRTLDCICLEESQRFFFRLYLSTFHGMDKEENIHPTSHRISIHRNNSNFYLPAQENILVCPGTETRHEMQWPSQAFSFSQLCDHKQRAWGPVHASRKMFAVAFVWKEISLQFWRINSVMRSHKYTVTSQPRHVLQFSPVIITTKGDTWISICLLCRPFSSKRNEEGVPFFTIRSPHHDLPKSKMNFSMRMI